MHRRRLTTALAMVGVVASALVGCGGDDGDKDAFCALLRDGVGIGSPDASDEDFKALREVAPVEIADAVRQLESAAKDIEKVDPDDLAGLFAARFSTESEAARGELLAYGSNECGIEGLSTGELSTDIQVLSDLRGYVDDNFANDAWARSVDFDVVSGADDGLNIQVRFLTEPTDALAIDACNAVAVFLYEVRRDDGAVLVRTPVGTLVAGRASAEDSCMPR